MRATRAAAAAAAAGISRAAAAPAFYRRRPAAPPPPAVAAQLSSNLSALASLTERLDTLEAYLVAVRSGAQPADRATLRAIAAAIDAVPAHEEDAASLLSQDIARVSGRADALRHAHYALNTASPDVRALVDSAPFRPTPRRRRRARATAWRWPSWAPWLAPRRR